MVCAALLVAACSPDQVPSPDTELRTGEQSVVYGDDNRLDYYAHPDEGFRDLTRNTTVAMMDSGSLDRSDPNDIRIVGNTLAQAYGLCDDQLFRDNPTAAGCSGTLIDDNLVLTAGHCISDRNCSSKLWVFDYFYVEDGLLETIDTDDVYSCSRIVAQSNAGGRGGADYAIVELDRPVVGREPAVFNFERWPVEDGEPALMIGFGSGIPAKLDDGGIVLDRNETQTQNSFRASVDAFGGNSGSGVFNDQFEVVGILVAGETDYEFSGGCTRVVELSETGGSQGGEQVTYAILAVDELCADGYPSGRLCDIEAFCGDGICSGGETSNDCPEDCGEPINPNWTCDAEFFGTGDGCDCECGAYDPDCDSAAQQVLNCERGEYCDDNGECASEDDGPIEPEVPAGWTCDAAFYGAGDGCDCQCGTIDADCEDPGQPVYNCIAGASCSTDGECIEPVINEPDVGPSPDVNELDAGTTTPDTGGTMAPDAGEMPADVNAIDDFRTGVSSGCAAAPGAATPALAMAWWMLSLLGLRRRTLA
ncbi:MAG: hypothetical protein ACI81R_003592 [Bradymonadia bacterium]|jgi:hypothetical protein